jgi:hypothetical protein
MILQPPRSSANPIKFEEFIGISKGLSISSAAASGEGSPGPDFLELGLSRAFNLRIQASGDTLVVSLVSTLNKGEFPPVRFEIIGQDETVTAGLLERRLHHLRQVYAVAFLVDSGRETDLANLLREHPLADLEDALIAEKDKLVIREATPGSLVLSLVAKSKTAYQALLYICGLPFAKGREALLGRITAGTALAELKVQEKTQDLRLKGAHGIIDLAKKLDGIKDKETRELIRKRLFLDVDGLTSTEVPPPKMSAIGYSPDSGPLFSLENTRRAIDPVDQAKKRSGAAPRAQD